MRAQPAGERRPGQRRRRRRHGRRRARQRAAVSRRRARSRRQQALAGPTSSRSAETTNYEVSRTTRHVIQPPGDVARLSVAVILDDDQVAKTGPGRVDADRARSRARREELQKIQALVAAAVGLETDRGDQLTVENVAFDEPAVEQGPPPGVLEQYSPQIWEGSRIAVVALLGVVALLVFVRPLVRKAGGSPAAKELAAAAGDARAGDGDRRPGAEDGGRARKRD